MKSEPTVYSMDDFEKDQKTLWEGIRNYQARNFMTQSMQVGDQFLFYHSSCEVPAAIGIGKVISKAKTDPSALDKKSPYYDSKSTESKPIWECVEVKFIKKFKTPVTLSSIRKDPKLLNMVLLQKGSRLSIQPVTIEEFHHICTLGGM